MALHLVAADVAAQVTLPHSFAPGQPARAAEVNANFATLLAAINALRGQSCPEGQFVRGLDANGMLVCAAPASAPFTGMLPPGATLRGRWGPALTLGVATEASGSSIVHISFLLALPSSPGFNEATNWLVGGAVSAECPGFVGGQWQAAPGQLCIYQTNSDAATGVAARSITLSALGVRLVLSPADGTVIPQAGGVWAVTAPLATP